MRGRAGRKWPPGTPSCSRGRIEHRPRRQLRGVRVAGTGRPGVLRAGAKTVLEQVWDWSSVKALVRLRRPPPAAADGVRDGAGPTELPGSSQAAAHADRHPGAGPGRSAQRSGYGVEQERRAGGAPLPELTGAKSDPGRARNLPIYRPQCLLMARRVFALYQQQLRGLATLTGKGLCVLFGKTSVLTRD